jgi:tagatose-1,6-bisphosphate aldolase non-catalytic subunit AgaZ/GatZ
MIILDKDKKEVELYECKECGCLMENPLNEVKYITPMGCHEEYYCNSHKKKYYRAKFSFDRIRYYGEVEMDKDGNLIIEKKVK